MYFRQSFSDQLNRSVQALQHGSREMSSINGVFELLLKLLATRLGGPRADAYGQRAVGVMKTEFIWPPIRFRAQMPFTYEAGVLAD